MLFNRVPYRPRLLSCPAASVQPRGRMQAVRLDAESPRIKVRKQMRELYDEYGNPHLCVDEELRRRLETKLITKLLTFRVR